MSVTEEPATADDLTTLSAEKTQTLKDWLDKKTKRHACPVCENQQWSMGGHLLHCRVYDDKRGVAGTGGYPQAFVVCTNCFYVRNFMAVPIGLVDATDGESSDV